MGAETKSDRYKEKERRHRTTGKKTNADSQEVREGKIERQICRDAGRQTEREREMFRQMWKGESELRVETAESD